MPKPLPRAVRSVTELLHRASQLADLNYATDPRRDNTTPRQFAVLAAIKAHTGPSQSQLVAATGMDRSTLSEVIARLRRDGLITANPSERDRRSQVVALTSAGEERLEIVQKKMQAADARLLRLLPSDDGRELVRLLQELLSPGALKARTRSRRS